MDKFQESQEESPEQYVSRLFPHDNPSPPEPLHEPYPFFPPPSQEQDPVRVVYRHPSNHSETVKVEGPAFDGVLSFEPGVPSQPMHARIAHELFKNPCFFPVDHYAPEYPAERHGPVRLKHRSFTADDLRASDPNSSQSPSTPQRGGSILAAMRKAGL